MSKSSKISDRIISLIIIVIVTGVVITGLYFHEPFGDEAQAYLLARDASWHDILLKWTHYEGHPPMWHILIKTACIFGAKFELTVKALNFIFAEAVLLMIELRSPFSRFTKAILPFSYFLLYQYSVISRPYMMLAFAFILTASIYKDRTQKPIRYFLSLLFMCTVHSYGIAFAGGIVIADIVGEAIREKSIRKPCMSILSNKKALICYLLLLAAAIALIIDIMPYSDTYAVRGADERVKHGFIVSYLFSFILIPSETLFTSFSSVLTSIQEETNPANEVIIAGVLSLLIWGALFMICKKRRMTAEMIIPYMFVSVLLSVYAFPYHFGVFMMYLIFILWTASDKEKITASEFTDKFKKAGLSEKLSRSMVYLAGVFFFCVNMYWNIMSYYNEIALTYSPGRSMAEWIKENDLENSRILTTWSGDDTNIYSDASLVANAYFDKSVFYNMHDGLSYVTHIVPDKEETEQYYHDMYEKGSPDFIVTGGIAGTNFVCEKLGFEDVYNAKAFFKESERIFKDKSENTDIYVMCSGEKYKELYGREYEVSKY